MADLLNKLDRRLWNIVSECGRRAEDLGFYAYLVGGPVRDIFLKRTHVDLDITIHGNGLRVAESFVKHRQGASLVKYPAFKTATVTLVDEQIVDFATARSETYSEGGAFPVVVPSDMKDDLFRRDFTINAMAISINPETWGNLLDPFVGLQDLKDKKLRVLHEKSFVDDPTRIVRAARFATRLGFTLEEKTLALLTEAVAKKALETIKPQRYAKEFNKILKEEQAEEAIKLLKQWNAYQAVLRNRQGGKDYAYGSN